MAPTEKGRAIARTLRLGLGLSLSVALAMVSGCAADDSDDRVATPPPDATSASRTLGASGTLFEPPPSAVDFTLTGPDQAPISLSDYRGEVVAIYFGYTFCPDICPLTLGTYKAALERLPEDVRDQMNVVMVTVDPERDSPEVLERYMAVFGEQFVGLTGTIDEVDAVLASWDIEIEREPPVAGSLHTVDHPAASWVVDREGRLRLEVSHLTGTDALVADLTTILEEGTE